MEEIKVGEYVRYKSGLIRKVSRIIPIYENDKLLEDKYYIEFEGKGDIGTYRKEQVMEFMTKHSPNIIDLIEEGDYVNGHLVYDKYLDTNDNGKDFITIIIENTLSVYKCLEEKDINSIVTKEQFNQVKYEV